MASGDVRKVSRQDIQLVQNLIERCLQLYMSPREVVKTLLQQAKIEPDFTELVWQKLEEENREFFEAYHLRLMVKEQISKFNRLLERQVELMHEICPDGVASIPIHNGSHIPSMQQNSGHYGPGQPVKQENMLQQSIGTTLPNAFTNGGASIHPFMQPPVDMSAHARRINVSPTINLAQPQDSNFGMIPVMNGRMTRSDAVGGYGGSSSFMYTGAANRNNVLEVRPPIWDQSVSDFNRVESSSQPLNETTQNPNSSSFGFLGQIPRNFSLSDLTADFSNSDILESYSRSPFLPTDSGNFQNSNGGGEHQGDVKRLNSIAEGLSYKDFGSD